MKRRIRILIIFGSVILALGLFYVIIFFYGKCFDSYNGKETYLDWMNQIKDETKIDEIVVPGSHDSGSYNMPHFTETQTYTIEQQLNTGIRYFDFRINKSDDGKLPMYHAFSNNGDFRDEIVHLKDFLLQNQSEMLFLDFQHFNHDSQIDLTTLIENNLLNNNLLIRSDREDKLSFISNLTLGQCRGKAIVFYGEKSTTQDYLSKPYIFFRNNDTCDYTSTCLNSYYDEDIHKSTSENLISKGFPKYYQNIKDKISSDGNKGIFVLQGQLTDGALLFGPYAKERSHNKNMTAYLDSLKEENHSEELSLLNVVMRDFINPAKVSQIIQLNQYKNNINPSLGVSSRKL